MGVRVAIAFNKDRTFDTAHDWYVTEDNTLQIYQKVEGDEQFVIAEFNKDVWEAVEYDRLPPLPHPETESETPCLVSDEKINRYEEEIGQ